MALITCDHCSFSYEGHTVLQDLSLQVERGEYLCIVGENGSGKSTLIKGLLGLIAPSKGKITYEAGFHNTEIGYLPQRTEAQKDFPASVWEVVSSGCRGLNLFPTKAQRELIDRNLALMGMEDRKKSSFAELSGGQQQRVLLARALCATQKMLLLDEPVSGLDPKVTAEMYTLIEKLNREDGITVIMISHDVAAAVRYASHILHIGDTVFFGTRADYLQSPQGRLFDMKKGGDSQ